MRLTSCALLEPTTTLAPPACRCAIIVTVWPVLTAFRLLIKMTNYTKTR